MSISQRAARVNDTQPAASCSPNEFRRECLYIVFIARGAGGCQKRFCNRFVFVFPLEEENTHLDDDDDGGWTFRSTLSPVVAIPSKYAYNRDCGPLTEKQAWGDEKR